MSKEKTKPKKEGQSLEMARQTLRRVKEMDLTPEQKAQVMAMIKEAKAHEKNRELSKALNLYNNLKSYLEDISAYSKDKIKVRQIEKIEKIIKDMGDESDMSQEQRWRLERLLDQIDIIKKTDKDKTDESIRYGEIELLPVTQFTMDQITEFISKVENLDKDDIFKISIIADENDDITWFDFGVAGNIEHVYQYIPAHLLINDDGESYVGGVGPDTVIHKSDVDLESGDYLGGYKVIAKWSEEDNKWFDDDGSEIKV